MPDEAVHLVLHGIREFEAALAEMEERKKRATKTALVEAAKVTSEEAGTKITSRTGTLARSITFPEPRESGAGLYSTEGGPHAVYARKHELGKRGRYHGPPHPYFEPGLRSASARFGEIFQKAWGEH